MKNTGRWKMRILRMLTVSLSLLAIVPSVHAGGGQDSSLSRADELIEARQYDDAIQILTEYIKKNPNDFAQAQKRLQRIVKIRDEYNALAEQLLDILENDPDNNEQILAITRRMSELDAQPNRMVQDFIDRARAVALFTYNRNQLERIITQGSEQLAAGQYTQALDTYAAGLNLYRDEFYAAGYSDMVVTRVNGEIDKITASIGDFKRLLAPLTAAAAGLEQQSTQAAGAGGIGALQNSYAVLEPLLLELMDLRNTLAGTADYFSRQLAVFQESDSTLGDASFLSFASRLILGPSSASSPEGMMGTMELLWGNTAGRSKTALAAAADRSYESALEMSLGGQYVQASAEFNALLEYDALVMQILSLDSLRESVQVPETIFIDGVRVTAANTPEYLKYYSMAELIPWFKDVQDAEIRFAVLDAEAAESFSLWETSGTTVYSASVMENSFRQSYLEFENSLEPAFAAVDARQQTVAGYLSQAGASPDIPDSFRDVRSRYERLVSLAREQEQNTAVRAYRMANEDVGRRLEQRESEFSQAITFIQGVTRTIDGAEPYTAKYPSEANTILLAMDQSLSGDIDTAANLTGRYEREDPNLRDTPEMTELYTAVQSMAARLEELRTLGRQNAAIAASQAAEAESYRLDGDRLYREAQNALARSDFDTARERVLRSGQQYDASLAIQDSDTLRADRDRRLLSLGAEITRLESEVIIREVRQLVTSAKNTYFAGNFESAEDMLVQAQNSWRNVYVDDDPEISYWLTIVRGALSLRSGRTIPATAPLYSEMSQLLSEAHLAYDEGVRFLNSGRRSEGLEKLSEARQKTQEVRLVFPVNEEASLLELRIDQVIDPAAFNVSFERRYTDAVEGVRQRQSSESFADLQNLVAINPQYPGIQSALYNAEITMGIRMPPPDTRAIARSNELTSSAQAIVNTNDQLQFPVALEQLNQALELNPNNNQAMILKDRVQILTGNPGSVVLSNAAEREYQRAVQELQQGNTVVALSIVQQLLQDPQNRNSTRIIELQRRIESIL
ncbi:hypothetical protein [Breznakiella homolactica]|uniref:Tetratricopeptide repeat protein n=1 Tax=Breznakiella homolactica TaxID=2798577 RepID=A0A7T8BDH4_9SPIR|nr:hypothetical protein [Breznakiella homolactica]QQO11268.1 hypothetical protein JFL75_10290 [Breznakiella homolactica]